MKNILLGLAPTLALGAPLVAFAQAALPAPTDSKATDSGLRYQSAFADYQPWQDIKPGNWRQLNDSVAPKDGKSAGHAGHGAAAVVPAAKSSAPAEAGQPSRHMHGGKP